MTGESEALIAEIRDVADLELVAAWRDLYARSLEPNIFLDPDFARPALGYLRPHGLKIMTVFETGQNRLLALAPVVPPTVPFGLARVYVHKQAALGLPLLAKDVAGPALAKLVDAVRALHGAPSALVFSEIPRDGPTFRLLNEIFGEKRRIHILGQYERPALLLAAAEHRVRSKTKGDKNSFRRLRRLGERGALSYRIARDAEVAGALTEFLALESSGWKGMSKTALASAPDRAGFVKAMAESFARDGKLQIESLDLDGKAVAMGLLIEDAGAGYFWKIAYDEAYAAQSPGILLVRELTGRLSAHRTLRAIDSCAAAEHPMIDHIWPERITILDVGINLADDPRGRIAIAAESLRRSLRKSAKRLLRRNASGKAPIAGSWRARS
ncbi:MAG: GNAT family N-acetyltransferase [Methylovirgula sp.]|uniref:GNAT family N-acetyltransferase n=1 Tax=Methylovirgula sp. TaxID=1978224 RepID=UPI0030763A3E